MISLDVDKTGSKSGNRVMNKSWLRVLSEMVAGLALTVLWISGSLAYAGDATWTNTLTGVTGAAWGEAGNWTNSAGINALPDNGSAFLTASGGSYAVNYDTAEPSITDLIVENTAPYTTDLTISAPLTTLAGGVIRLKGGSSVTVTNGGVWKYEGTNSVVNTDESMLSIRNGGELNITGGEVAFTNLLSASTSYNNYINVGYQSTGTLNVTSGRLDYYEQVPRAYTNNNRSLRIGRGTGGNGTLNISGGTVALGMYSGGGASLTIGAGSGAPIGSTRGKVVVSGGELVFTNNPGTGWNQIIVGQNYGIGTLIVTNTGYVDLRAGGVSARVYAGQTPYGHGTLRMDGGYMRVGDGVTIGTSSGYSDAVSSTGILEVTDGTLDAGSGLHIASAESGSSQCFGFGNITGGRVIEGYWGFFVGRARNGGRSTGSMTITNGVLYISSSAAVNDSNGAHSGIGIGVIHHNDENAGSSAWGEMTVSGSAGVTNKGVLVIGVNGATGTIIQAGGIIHHAPPSSDKFTVLGYGTGATSYFGGGNGTYEMSGGSYYTPNRVFVGGVPTDIQSFSREDGIGALKVTGGTFTADDIMMVGGYGTGTLTIGQAGSCSVENLVLTNNTQSVLRFELGADSLGVLSVSDTLSISSGARLEVDATAYQGSAVWIKLVECATRTTSFAPEDITVIGSGTVRQDRDEDIWLNIQHGTMIIVL